MQPKAYNRYIIARSWSYWSRLDVLYKAYDNILNVRHCVCHQASLGSFAYQIYMRTQSLLPRETLDFFLQLRSFGAGTRSAHRLLGSWKPSKLPVEPTRRWRLVRLPERDLAVKACGDRGDRDESDEEDVDDARRWRCMRVGSISGMFARRAKIARTVDRGSTLSN